MLYFKPPSGRLIPLDALADITEEIGPQAIAHSGQFPAATVSFAISPGHALGRSDRNGKDDGGTSCAFLDQHWLQRHGCRFRRIPR